MKSNEKSHLDQSRESQPLVGQLSKEKTSKEEMGSVQHHLKKDKFSKRMRQLAPQITTLNKTYKKTSPEANSPRARNNHASKQSRKRRKIYIELLEQNITNLERRLSATQDEIQQHRASIFNALMHTNENSQSAQVQSHSIRKLSSLVQEQPSAKIDSQINICLDSCFYRIGPTGGERKAILDILYTGMINRNLPNAYRYILWSAVNKTHLFQEAESNKDPWWAEIKEIGQQVISTNSHFLRIKRDPIALKGKEVLACSRRTLEQKKQIQHLGQSYDQLLKMFRKILTPTQIASLCLFVQRSIHREELRLYKQQAQQSDRQGSRESSLQRSEPKKKVKIDMGHQQNQVPPNDD